MKMLKYSEKLKYYTVNTPILIHLDSTVALLGVCTFILLSIHFIMFDTFQSKLQTLLQFTLKYFSMHIIT